MSVRPSYSSIAVAACMASVALLGCGASRPEAALSERLSASSGSPVLLAAGASVGNGSGGTGGGTLSVGTTHACLIRAGALFCWGDNSSGQLGNGTYVRSPAPVAVLGMTRGVQAVSAGGDATCAIQSGALYCWGDARYGLLGIGASSVPTPTAIATRTVVDLSSGVDAVSTSGFGGTCAIKAGALYCWGWNPYGQVGDGTTSNRMAPVSVSGLSAGVSAVAASQYRTCAVVAGAAKCWGYGGYLGNGTEEGSLVAVPVKGLDRGVTAIAVNSWQSCAIVNGAARCWGSALSLGNGSAYSLVPVQVTGLSSGVTALSLGLEFGCAVVGGALKCWGDNGSGELGNGTTTSASVPVSVSGLGTSVSQLASGGSSTCAMVDGALSCWGQSTHGELGSNSYEAKSVPVPVLGLSPEVLPPAGLSYAGPTGRYVAGTDSVGDNAPSVGSGPAVNYSVWPPFPAGIALDTTTGHISGIPTASTAETPYTLIAANLGGFSTTRVTFAVALPPAAPLNPSYTFSAPDNGYQYTVYDYVSASISLDNSPSPPPSFRADALPDWLYLDPATGALSGIPYAAGTFYFQVTAYNRWGSMITSGVIHIMGPVDAKGSPGFDLSMSSEPNIPVMVGTGFSGSPLIGWSQRFSGEALGSPSFSFNAVGLPDSLSPSRDTGEVRGSRL